jgi:hypothetical protein
VAIITATNGFVTAPIAQAFGVEHLIAAMPELDAARPPDRQAARHADPGPGKVTHMHAWLEAGQAAGRFRTQLFLQRFAQRHPAAVRRLAPGGDQPERRLERTPPPSAGLYSNCSMIKKFIRKILGVKDERDPTQPVILGPDEHGIDPKLLSSNAVRVTRPCRKPASRPSSSAAPCATCCWA